MNFNASIIDQRVIGIVEEHPEWLPTAGDDLNRKNQRHLFCCASRLVLISPCTRLPN